MPANIHKMKPLFDDFKKQLLDAHEFECKEFSKELEREGRRLLNLTLEKRRPQSGFAAARVRIDRKIKRTNRGCIVEMHFLVADGGSRKPHWKWHIINRGRKPFTAKKPHRFQVTKAPRTMRTKVRKLEVSELSGESGWVTMTTGRRYGKIRGRQFYKETVRRLKAKTLRKTRFKFLEVTEFEVNNG